MVRAFVRPLALSLLLFTAACAGTPQAAPGPGDDPLEGMNRAIFKFNLAADDHVLRPVGEAWRDDAPKPVQKGVHSFLSNLGEPLVFVNALLQGRWKAAHDTFARFLANTLFGIGGVFDVADDMGLHEHDADFGQTLYAWGVPSGPYLMLPLLGPSDLRDAAGFGVDSYADPVSRLAAANGAAYADWGRDAVAGVDERSRHIDDFDQLRNTSLDFYTSLRSVWSQHRAFKVTRGKVPAIGIDDVPSDE